MTPPDNRASGLIRATSVLIRGVFRLSGGYQVRGTQHVPLSGPAILASNHLSWADPPALRAALDRRCWFMANDFLFRIPVLGPIIPHYGAFPVRRGGVDREALRLAEQHLKEGDLVCVFPEGGTSFSRKLVPFEGGVALMALRAGVPILPAAITGTDRVWPMGPKHPKLPRWAKGGVTITFGPLVHPEDLDPDIPRRERVDLLTQRIQDAVAALLPAEYLTVAPE